MKIFVTGAYGQLGREVCRQLGDAAIASDYDTLDLRKGDEIRQTIADLRPDAVIHCSAYTQVDRAEEEPIACRLINAQAVAAFADGCRQVGCPLLYVSTDYVFAGSAQRRPFVETDEPAPLGLYAITKREGELAAAAWEKHWIVRTCGLYARPSHVEAKNFVRTILRVGRARGQVRVVNDQHCTPSYVPHVARALLEMVGATSQRTAPWGTYHVVNSGATTWHAMSVEIFRLAGFNVQVDPISTAEYAFATPRPAYSVLDTTRYHALDYAPMPDWQAALAEYFAEWRELPEEQR